MRNVSENLPHVRCRNVKEVSFDVSETQELENNFEILFRGSVHSSRHPLSAWEVNLCIDPNEKPIIFEIGLESDVTIISRETYESHPQLPRLGKPDVVLAQI